ncbi:YkgJ family cysteine cluster protein [bacterium]|nr:YkgJ family cysteine cluster protein [bacterium]
MENLKEQLEGYCLYLKLVQERIIDKSFKEQAPYICCKEGCSHCCERGQYPVSEIEVRYIMLKFAELDEAKKTQILDNIQKIINEKKNKNISSKDYFYQCPFLLDKKCSVYENRAIICRTHGLMFFVDEANGSEKYKIPFCVNLGLNYSNVYDKDSKTVTEEAAKIIGAEIPPQAYNLSLKTLTKKEITEHLGFEFGEIKPLVEWFM